MQWGAYEKVLSPSHVKCEATATVSMMSPPSYIYLNVSFDIKQKIMLHPLCITVMKQFSKIM